MKGTRILQHLEGKTYREVVSNLRDEADSGDCCGYAEVDIENGLENFPDKENAILVGVVELEYGDESSAINFLFDLGDQKGLILGYRLTAGSGTGWNYGQYASLYYGEDLICEV